MADGGRCEQKRTSGRRKTKRSPTSPTFRRRRRYTFDRGHDGPHAHGSVSAIGTHLHRLSRARPSSVCLFFRDDTRLVRTGNNRRTRARLDDGAALCCLLLLLLLLLLPLLLRPRTGGSAGRT